jgi:hypothetical protein
VFFLPLSVAKAEVNPFDKEYFNWSFKAGLLILASDNGPSADPMAILPFAGGSFSWQFMELLSLEITEDLYFTNYEFNDELGYPMACNPENRAAFVMGFVTGINIAGVFPLNEKGVTARVSGGPAFDLRLVTLAFGLNRPDDQAIAKPQTKAISDYFWSSGRMFLFSAGGGMDFPFSEKYALGFDLRVWMPLYRLWSDENSPSIDGWRFALALRISSRR